MRTLLGPIDNETAELPDDIPQQNEPNDNDPNDELLDPNLPNPAVFPLPGDRITFLDRDIQPPQPPTLINARVTVMFKTVQQKWPGWYNILRDNSSSQTSVDLVNTRWRFIPVDIIPQVDGNYTLHHDNPNSDDQFIDDNISDQGSLFGDSHI